MNASSLRHIVRDTGRVLAVACVLSAGAAHAEPVSVTATPVLLDPATPEATDVGRLIYRGGLHLTSGDPRFGGFSALGVSADGRRMLSVSDQGASFSANLIYDAAGNLSGLEAADLGSLADPDGNPLTGKYWGDAEAMSPGVDGEIIIAFEQAHRIWRYDPGVTEPRVLRPPAELAGIDANNGIEALTLLHDGRLFAIAEGSEREDATVAWISNSGGWEVLTYTSGGGFRPTGAATLENGDVAVVERFYTPRAGVRVRIKIVRAGDLVAGSSVAGTEIARLAPPLSVDNFEGIEAIAGRDGRQMLYLISDDNFNASQRTLLMLFEVKSE